MHGEQSTIERETITAIAWFEIIKIHANHVVSSPGVKFYNTDMGNFYVNTILPEPIYMRIHRKDIPQEIMDEYNLTKEHVDYKEYAISEVIQNNIWHSTIRTTSTWYFKGVPQQMQIHTNETYSRIVEIWKTTDTLHISCWGFWNLLLQ